MLILFKAMVIPVLEYYCLLWSPGTVGLIRKLEAVQRSFTHKISRMRDLSIILGETTCPQPLLIIEEEGHIFHCVRV